MLNVKATAWAVILIISAALWAVIIGGAYAFVRVAIHYPVPAIGGALVLATAVVVFVWSKVSGALS